MKKACYLIGLLITLSLWARPAEAQLIAVKPWHGYYPEMGGDYPLSFVSFKGWLFPVPHIFIRTWPTHYYIQLGALPVSDAGGYTDLLRVNFMKIVLRKIEEAQMKSRCQATNGIRDNRQAEKEIEQSLFDSRSGYKRVTN